MSSQFSPSFRPTYKREQISAYFDHVKLPLEVQQNLLSPSFHLDTHPGDVIEALRIVQIHQLSHVPFENLSIHYSPHHAVSIDAEVLFQKIVGNARGRGGYCMENNCFLGTVLRSLGFNIYSAGARVLDGHRYTGWGHMVNIVTLVDRSKYVLDVGFGGDGATRPLPLVDGQVSQGICDQELRLIKSNIEPNTDPTQRLWIYQVRSIAQDEWRTVYAFTELEFLPQDYEVMNFFTSQSRKTWFTRAVMAVKMLMAEKGEKVIGKVSLYEGVVKRTLGGQTEEVARCKTEAERVQALETWLGIVLTEDERRGIGGLVSDLGNG
ncbi:MAG: hypothetical protein Q9191_001746 [Dirinaria sp. TL-2023a]